MARGCFFKLVLDLYAVKSQIQFSFLAIFIDQFKLLLKKIQKKRPRVGSNHQPFG